MTKMGPIISIDNVTVRYRESVALRGISLSVSRGEFVGIIGPNGAGKTTLLTLVNGLTHPTEGEVRVLGLPVSGGHVANVRERVGYVPQVHNIDPRLPITVRETVMVGRYARLGLFHRPGPQDRDKVNAVLDMVGLGALAGRPLGHLSGGERQKTAIARSLAQEPEILLLDEPTASLDLQAQREILNLVSAVHRARGLTTLYVTHDLDSLPRDCGRVLLMKEGRVWREGPPESLLTEAVLADLYAGASPGRRSAAACLPGAEG